MNDSGLDFEMASFARFIRTLGGTIYHLAAARESPALKMGGRWEFSRANFDLKA